jgi:hypothetical protein
VPIPAVPSRPPAAGQGTYASALVVPDVYAMLRADRVLISLVVLQALLTAGVFTGIVLPGVLIAGPILVATPLRIGLLAFLGAAAWVAWWPALLCMGAVVVSVFARAEGRSRTANQCIRVAWTRRRQLAAWILTASRLGPAGGFHDWYGVFGSRVRFADGLGWGLATTFALPIIVIHGAGPREAMHTSVTLLRDRLGVSARGSERLFVQWAGGAVAAGVVCVFASGLFVHFHDEAPAWAAVSVIVAVVAAACAFGALATYSAARAILDTLTFRHALGLSVHGIHVRHLPALRSHPGTQGPSTSVG